MAQSLTPSTTPPSDQAGGSPPAEAAAPVASTATPSAPASHATTAPAPAPASPAVHARRSQPHGLGALYILAVAVAVGGIAFAVGRLTAPAGTAAGGGGNAAALAAGRGQFPTGSFQPGAIGGLGLFGGGATITGTVVSVDGATLTLRTASGGTVSITVGDSTAYHQQAAGSSSDVKAGATVQVQVSGAARGSTGTGGTTGQGGAPNASGAPAFPVPSGAPAGAGQAPGGFPGTTGTLTATDVTIVAP